MPGSYAGSVRPLAHQGLQGDSDLPDDVLALVEPSVERLVDLAQGTVEGRNALVEDRLARGRELEQCRTAVARVRRLPHVSGVEEPLDHVALRRPRQARGLGQLRARHGLHHPDERERAVLGRIDPVRAQLAVRELEGIPTRDEQLAHDRTADEAFAHDSGLSASDRLQLPRGRVQAQDPLRLPLVHVQGAVGRDRDAVHERRGDDARGHARGRCPRDAAAHAAAHDVAGVDAPVGADRERDGDAHVAAEGRDQARREIDAPDAAVLRVGDVERAVVADGNRVRVEDLRCSGRPAVSAVPLRPVSGDRRHGPVRRDLLDPAHVNGHVEVPGGVDGDRGGIERRRQPRRGRPVDPVDGAVLRRRRRSSRQRRRRGRRAGRRRSSSPGFPQSARGSRSAAARRRASPTARRRS